MSTSPSSWIPDCREHVPATPMREVIVQTHFPLGTMPVRGFRCPVCGAEVLRLADSVKAEALARKLGLFGLEDVQVRTLQRTGTSTCVTLDPELLRRVMPRAKRGSKVRIGRQGSRIVIEAVGG